MYRTSLNHLDPKTLQPTLEIGIREHGKLSELELKALLTRFCQIDPTENVKVEPEVRVELKGDRYILQTGSGKIHFYNARNRHLPAIVLTPGEVLAELTRLSPPPRPMTAPAVEPIAVPGDVSSERPVETRGFRPVNLPGGEDDLVYVPPPPPRPSRRVPILAVTLVLLLGGIGFVWFRGLDPAPTPESAGQSLPADDAIAARRALIGVYMTGGEPGRHGIAIAEDGAAKFFRLNAQVAPSVVFDTIKPGRRGSSTVALVEGLGTVIEMTGPDTLVYCGETFRRVP